MGTESRRGSSTVIYSTLDGNKIILEEDKVATRYDEEKPMMALVDSYAHTELARVLTFGASKYDRENWRKGMQWSRCISSLERHIAAFKMGQDVDPETGINHMAHAMCNAMFLVWYSEHRKEFDDRWRESDGHTTHTSD